MMSTITNKRIPLLVTYISSVKVRSRFLKKSNKQWIWLALDAKTREIVGVQIGDRSREGARKLLQSLPPVYRQCAVCYSDFWEAYE